MAADRKLIVAVVGDDSSLQATLKRSSAAVAKFGQDVDKNLRKGISTQSTFDPLLKDIRKLRTEGEQLQDDLRKVDTSGRDVAVAGAKIAAGLFAAGRAAEGAGTALEVFQGHASATSRSLGDAGEALTSLITLNPAGFFKSIGAQAERTREALTKYAASLSDTSQATVALQVAQGASALGFEKQAEAIRDQVAALNAAQAATDALAFAQREFNVTVIDGISTLVAFKGARDAAFGGGPATLQAPDFGAPGMKTLPAMSPSQRRELELITAQETARLPLLQDRLRQLTNQLADFNGNQEQRLRLATRVKTTEAEIAGIYKSQAAAAKAASDAAKSAAKQRSADAARAAREAAERARRLREAKLAAEQARQFRALGLAATGGEIVPGSRNLQTRIAGALRRIGSGELDVSSKLVSRLKLARKLIKKEGGNLTQETRQVIDSLIKTVTKGQDKLDQATGGPITKTTSLNANRILAGLGIGPDAERELRQRLSKFNSAGLALAGARGPTGQFRGGVPVTQTNITVEIDGEAVGRATRKTDQKNRRRNPVQKRGSRRGGV